MDCWNSGFINSDGSILTTIGFRSVFCSNASILHEKNKELDQGAGIIEAQGVKVKAVEVAIKALEKVIDNPVTRWALEAVFDEDTVAAVLKQNKKIFSVLDEYLYAVDLTTREIAAGAKDAIIRELRGVVGKETAQSIGQVVEWLIYYGSKILL
ncbi:hypothetical protein DNH61_17820 [Paenibacillus sambharensis]|uniref:Uncharacterized protein n=1 Tax=Paenibacillus sambharensis TaxID=1803190 RepID=A0A2W1L5R3_9BACL|nr:hypothetical protein [Paenibacillus sambharensis]PZD94273.1 hypothetical protein DNH61_17820 [Paenibacillus sambharensis]